MRNPWADRWENEIGAGFQAPGREGRIEQEMMKAEADHARSMPVQICKTCGKDSFYRPGVTGYWCKDHHLNRNQFTK